MRFIQKNQVKCGILDKSSIISSLISIASLSTTSDDIIRDISNRYPEGDLIDLPDGYEILRDSITNDYKVVILNHS